MTTELPHGWHLPLRQEVTRFLADYGQDMSVNTEPDGLCWVSGYPTTGDSHHMQTPSSLLGLDLVGQRFAMSHNEITCTWKISEQWKNTLRLQLIMREPEQ